MANKQEKSAWSAKQLKLIELLADPDNHMTQEQMCQKVGICRYTFWKWRNLPGFDEAVYERAMVYLNRYLPKTLKDMQRSSAKGSVDAMKLILQHCGKLKEKVESEVKVVISWDEEESVGSGD